MGKASPTADLYVANPCAELIADGEMTRLAPTVFRAGATLIVVRHALWLDRAVTYNRLIYVMDDDYRAGLSDTSLPRAFRAKLALVEARAARRIAQRADQIVAGSPVLAAQLRKAYPGKPVVALDPVWPVLPDRAEPRERGPLRLAYLGGVSHRRDFDQIAPVLRDLLDRHGDVTLTLPGQISPPAALAQHQRVHVLKAMDWRRYASWLETQEFDIGLYPLCNTAFNASRSINKLMEYTRCGACVLAGPHWPVAHTAPWQGAVRFTTETPQAWRAALDDLIANRPARRTLVKTARTAIAKHAPHTRATAFWHDTLSIRPDSVGVPGTRALV